jgi:hypothetical protein
MRSLTTRLGSRARTVSALFAHFFNRGKFFLLPLMVILLLASVLLIATGGLSFVAPFLYAIF